MKKWKMLLAAGALIFACVGCGTKQAVPSSQEAQTEEIQTQSSQSESEVEERNNAAADLGAKTKSGESAAFAEQIKTAMVDKDMEALADLCAYPLAVNGDVIESRDDFLKLDSGDIFTEQRCAVIEAADISTLEETMAGVVMGDATPNIIFKSVDGKLGITGIN